MSIASKEPASGGFTGERQGASPGLSAPALTLARREIVRFIRQRSRIIGALGTPLVFWMIVGGGLGRSFSLGEGDPDVGYMEYTFPGALAAILLFTAIFSMISIIDDRRDGFMQCVLVAPISRLAVVLGKVSGASVLAVAQAALFLVLAPLADIRLGVVSVLLAIAAMFLVAIAVAGLGFWIAWIMESTQGFHAIMNLVLMPMLILSGAFFPPGGSAAILRWLTYLNPMTYGVALLRHAIYFDRTDAMPSIVGAWPALGATVVFTAAMLALSMFVATRGAARTLQ